MSLSECVFTQWTIISDSSFCFLSLWVSSQLSQAITWEKALPLGHTFPCARSRMDANDLSLASGCPQRDSFLYLLLGSLCASGKPSVWRTMAKVLVIGLSKGKKLEEIFILCSSVLFSTGIKNGDGAGDGAWWLSVHCSCRGLELVSKTHCLGQGNYWYDEIPWPKASWEGKGTFQLTVPHHSPLLREVKAGTQAGKQKLIKGCCLLSCSSRLAQPAFLAPVTHWPAHWGKRITCI